MVTPGLTSCMWVTHVHLGLLCHCSHVPIRAGPCQSQHVYASAQFFDVSAIPVLSYNFFKCTFLSQLVEPAFCPFLICHLSLDSACLILIDLPCTLIFPMSGLNNFLKFSHMCIICHQIVSPVLFYIKCCQLDRNLVPKWWHVLPKVAVWGPHFSCATLHYQVTDEMLHIQHGS